MVTFKQLDSKNACFNPGLLKRLSLLYKGGYAVQANADFFLHQLASETPASFEDRKKCVAYLPFMSDTIDYYTSLLFAGEVSISEAGDADDASTLGSEADDASVYKLFLAAADLKGNSFEEVMRKVMTDALIHQESFVGLDFPTADELPVNLLEEEVLMTARPYVYYVDPDCVIDWSCNEADKFNWVKIKSDCVVQPDPLQPPMHQIEFKIWKMENGIAKWELYQTKLLPINKQPAPNDAIDMVANGTTSFKEIPILKLCLPDGLALGCKIGPICEDIFQRSSILVNGENKSINAMRVVYLGDEAPPPGGALPSMVQENPFRAMALTTDWEQKGFGVLGANDKMEVIESQGHAFKIVDEQIDKLIEKLKEVVHQMANSASAHTKQSSRSAASQQEGRHATEMLLTAYGSLTRDFIKAVMNCISSARGESIVWTVDGLDNFSLVDRAQLILEAKEFPGVTDNSKSLTFSRLYTEKFYLSLLDGASHEDALQIRQEIMDAVDEGEMQAAQPMQDAKSMPTETAANSSDNTPESIPVGKSGHLQGFEGMHLQTGEHVDSEVVHSQLAEDYKDKDIEWVLHIPWQGPMEVPLTSIDFSNKDNWKASEEPDKVGKFADKIANEGFDKPIILVNNPSNNGKMVIVDGHHRALAYMENGQAVLAYVGSVGKNNGPWDKLHSKQVGSKQASLSSNQLVSNQVKQ